ncbi:accessory gene regulator B family protein [Sporosarcina sp. NCCP-2222]
MYNHRIGFHLDSSFTCFLFSTLSLLLSLFLLSYTLFNHK